MLRSRNSFRTCGAGRALSFTITPTAIRAASPQQFQQFSLCCDPWGAKQRLWPSCFVGCPRRVYFIVPAKAHADILVRRCLQFLDTPWVANGHFEIRLP